MCQVSPLALNLRTLVLLICGDAREKRVHKPKGTGSVCVSSMEGVGGCYFKSVLSSVCGSLGLHKGSLLLSCSGRFLISYRKLLGR